MGRYKTGLMRDNQPCKSQHHPIHQGRERAKSWYCIFNYLPTGRNDLGAATAEVPGSRRERRLPLVVAGWGSYDSMA
ncbi:hypothetical protein [Geitlerinema sp. PCC 9228]|uniref:hypothetical protein n=1 Tax=Geitlerinema sp. PCC 9228 TaxID=111611 RepID=UPI001114A5C6|nr:hypothetical protein [Geitlerinema sp. PCC 9228]